MHTLRVVAVLLALLLPSQSWAAAIVNTSAKFAHTADVTNQALGFTPTVGNHLFVMLSGWQQGGTSGVTTVTNTGNTWAEDIERLATASGNAWASIWSTKVAVATTTVSLTFSGPFSTLTVEWCVIEVSGLDATTHKDQTGSGIGGTTGDALATASGVNTTTAGIALAAASVSNADADINISDTPPTGYTNIRFNEDSNATIGFSAVRKIYSGSETSSAQFVHDNTSQFEWAAVIATYKDAAGGGGPNVSNFLGRRPQ